MMEQTPRNSRAASRPESHRDLDLASVCSRVTALGDVLEVLTAILTHFILPCYRLVKAYQTSKPTNLAAGSKESAG